MKSPIRYSLFFIYISCSALLFYLLAILIMHLSWLQLLQDWTFILTLIFYLLTIEEFYQWARNGKRSELSDIVAIMFFFFLILFFSKDFLTSLMGAFSIYLWIGIFELKDYPVLNKILIISLVTYNVIFIAGIFSFYLDNPRIIETSFAFSFWIILIMGFILFGRKYLVVWRFLSPEYLTLFLYIIAWLSVVFIDQFTPFNLVTSNPFTSNNFSLFDFFLNIYFILILVNWLIYFISGIILDKMLGIKKIENPRLTELITNVKNKIGIKGNVKVGFGKYPILNAMAYGSFFDKRIAIIAEDLNQIPEDELKGIVAHELAHTKGKHTLILTIITTCDLFIRMLFGIPATFYDYTFGNPQLPLFLFIFLNLSIYVVLFIFVRMLEGKADLKAKISGYGNELVKALYNLESFYASGREIGLNTMLLCEEKISKDNQLLDYMNTASYLNNSMIKPSKASLLGNFLNSHPPSYIRIAAILNNELKPGKEALLSFICLKKSKQKKYAKLFENSRQAFKNIANEKFKEFFKINDVPSLLNDLRRKELYKYELNKDFLFTNKINDDKIFGNIVDIQFLDDISDSDQFIITNLKTNKTEYLSTSLYTRVQINLNEKYYLEKNSPLILKNIIFNDKKNDGNYIFMDNNNQEIRKSIPKTKLPNSVAILLNLKDNVIFFKHKAKLKVLMCVNVSKANNLKDYELVFSDITNPDKKPLKYSLKELIIRPRSVYLSISKSQHFRKSEVKVINWLKTNHIFISIYLKKPVNNAEHGYIQNLDVKIEDPKKSKNEEQKHSNSLSVKNIFGKNIVIPYDKVELISFEYNSALIQIKSATSFSSRLGYKILKKFKPDKIIST
ncbi:MAG: M48 family metalloprotease [Candidatus Lokiarchaeota archaeon]|nr:M48 family metalloprotease [Candidatus Lokiarchaeota archaeon]